MSYILQVLKKIISGPLELFPLIEDKARAIGILSDIQGRLSSRILWSTLDLKPCEFFGVFRPHYTNLIRAKETPSLLVFRGVQSIQKKLGWTNLTLFDRSQILLYAKATQCLLKEYESDFNQEWTKKDGTVEFGYHVVNNYLKNVVELLGTFPSSELEVCSLKSSLEDVEKYHRDVRYFYGKDKGKLTVGEYDHSSGHYEDLVAGLDEDTVNSVREEISSDFKGDLRGLVPTSSLAQLKQYCQIIEASQQPKPNKPIMVDQATQTDPIQETPESIKETPPAKPAEPFRRWSRIPALSVGQQLEPWTQEQRGLPIFQPDVSPGSVFSFIWHLPSGQYTGLLAQVSDVQGDFLRVNYEASLLLLSSKSSSTPGTTLIKGSPLGIQEEVVRGIVEMSPRKFKSFVVDQLGQITSEQLAGFVQQMVVINRLMHRPGEESSTSLIEAPAAELALPTDEEYTLASPPSPLRSDIRVVPLTPPRDAYGPQERDVNYFVQQLKEKKEDEVIRAELVDLTEEESLVLSEELKARIAAAERAYAELTTESACMDVLRERNTLSLRKLSFLLSAAEDEASEPLAQAEAEEDSVGSEDVEVVTIDDEPDVVDRSADELSTPSGSDDESSEVGDGSLLSDSEGSSIDVVRVMGQVVDLAEKTDNPEGVVDSLRGSFDIEGDGYSQQTSELGTFSLYDDDDRPLVYVEERDKQGNLKAIYTKGIGRGRLLGKRLTDSIFRGGVQGTKIEFKDNMLAVTGRQSWDLMWVDIGEKVGESIFTGIYIKPEYEFSVRKEMSRFMRKHFTERGYSRVRSYYQQSVNQKEDGESRSVSDREKILSTLFLDRVFSSLSRVQIKQRGKSPGRSPFWRRR